MNLINVEELLKKHEGFRLKLYKDTVGKLTIGIGRNIEDNGIREDEALYMLKNDIQETIQDLKKIFPDFETYPEAAQLVMIDMMFNLGYYRFSEFKNMIAALKARDWKKALMEMQDSKWCKELQERCKDNSAILSSLFRTTSS